MPQFPATINAIMSPKTGDVNVIEQTDRPFPEWHGLGSVILKTRAVAIHPVQPTMTYLFISTDVGRLCQRQLHRHLLPEQWTLARPAPYNCQIGNRWSDCHAPY